VTAARALATARLRVGVQGETGCFSHAALRQFFGDDAEPTFHGSFASAVDALARGDTDRLLLPVWNSLAGVVRESLRAIADQDLRVDDETVLPIRLVCAALPGSRLDHLVHVRSHPVALRQCSRFLAHHPRMAAEAVHDTAGAARLLAESRDRTAAVVTSAEAAEVYGLEVLATDIQDRADNHTRFWLLARRQLAPAGTAARAESHLAGCITPTQGAHALRGAISVDDDTVNAITSATHELLVSLLEVNGIEANDVVSAIFTLTPDLTAHFPANAARQLGWHGVPMLCASEIAVPGSLPRCLRVLLHVRAPAQDWMPSHVYLGEAKVLRRDL
jgi:monofunctional chorismate mutase